MDDKRRIALVETVAGGTSTIRLQFANHLGTSCLELDGAGEVITYEEYYPYGSTSYQAGRSIGEVSLKCYRYTGKERDEENGFSFYGARYYAPWLGRWISPDLSTLLLSREIPRASSEADKSGIAYGRIFATSDVETERHDHAFPWPG